MKLNKTLLTTAILTVFLSSCGSLNIGTKRYSRGLNISWFSNKEKVKQNSGKPADERKTELASKPVKETEVENGPIENGETIAEATDIVASTHQSATSNSKLDVRKPQLLSEKRSMKQAEKTEKKQNALIKKIHKINQKLSPESIDSTHESSGLGVIGWILIILGLLVLLVASILLGIILMLLGLLFVVVGK